MNTQSADSFCRLKQKALEQYFATMNEMQKQAVFHVEGPLLILAGAGSGKTTVLINRIACMVRFGNAYFEPAGQASDADAAVLQAYLDGQAVSAGDLAAAMHARPIRPWNILAITFTNKAAGELKERLAAALGATGYDVQASTFHSLCVRILRREIEALGYGRSFAIYDADDSVRVIKDCVKAAQLDDKMFPPRAVLSAISRAKDALQSPEDLKAASGDDYRMENISKIYGLYQNRLRDANALDFDDLIVLTVRLLQQFPQVRDSYRDRFRYVMVDEYQDTNHAQYMLVSLLASGHRNLCVVGDDDQSIYKFRGATIENILSFEDQFEDAKVIRLEQNYRSTQNILSAANHVIENNTGRKGKNLWTSSGDGDRISIVRMRDELEEARLIADSILENVKNGAKFSDHAVLYRMNAQSNSVEKGLVKNAIPYRIVGGVRFYERKEIKDMVAYLSVLANPSDTLRLLRIINEPKRGIGNSTLSTAQEIAEGLGISLYEVIAHADEYEILGRKSGQLLDFISMLNALSRMADEGALDELLEELLERTGYRSMLQAQGFEGAGRLENIMELKSNLVRYKSENETPTLSGFLEEIALYTDLDDYSQDDDRVVLMTIHSAKGLEFPWVFLAGMDEGIFPGRAVQAFPQEIEEERRLAYVAITRAKHNLICTSAERRMLFGQTIYGRPSRFLSEIPEQFCEKQDKTVIKRDPNAPERKPSRPRGAATASSTTIGVCAAAPEKAEGKKAFAAGDNVLHKVFGEGRVISAKAMGNDMLVEIDFAGNVRRVMANYAPLTRI